MEKTITIPGVYGDPMTTFFGTDEEIANMEKQEENTKAAWIAVVENPDFSALGFQSGNDYYIVSRTTDENGYWRLTSFWNGKMPNGKTYIMDPSYHEYYAGKSEGYKGSDGLSLFDVLARYCHNKDLKISVV